MEIGRLLVLDGSLMELNKDCNIKICLYLFFGNHFASVVVYRTVPSSLKIGVIDVILTRGNTPAECTGYHPVPSAPAGQGWGETCKEEIFLNASPQSSQNSSG